MADSTELIPLFLLGVIIYAAITVFLFPGDFEKDDKPVASYAFPFYIVGTTLLFAGMLFCAIIIERSSKQYYLKPNKPKSKIYWLQPGNQHVGDQVFGAFMAVKLGPESSISEGPEYIKSTRFPKYDGRYVELYTVLGSTMLGFIIQFVGLRGLHASVILAQLGSTFIMSILRTCLRTQRMAPEENLLKDERDLATQKKQELDAFAFYLHKVASFEPTSSTTLATSRSNSSDTYVAHPEKQQVKEIIATRALLADITSKQESKHGVNVPWDDIPTRKVAKSLADTIGMTMDLLSSWGVDYEKDFQFDLSFECKPEGSERTSYSHRQHPVRVQRSGDALKWKVNQNELEAIIGLSTWSLYKFDEGWKSPLVRMVGLNESEAGTLEMYLDFHKWIFRQTEAKLVSAKMVDSPKRLFGFDSDRYAYDNDILIVRTDSSVETMVAQDIYIHFLRSALTHLSGLDSDAEVLPGIQGTLTAQHGQINDLVSCFENCNLGSREDALLCAIPVLRAQGLLPSLAAYSPRVRALRETFIQQNEWTKAFKLLEWVCQRSNHTDFEYSVYELGYLCRRALLVKDVKVCKIGLEYTCKLLAYDLRKQFFDSRGISAPENWSESQAHTEWRNGFTQQLGWVAWHISVNTSSAKWIQPTLQEYGARECLDTQAELGEDLKYPLDSIKALKEWITLDDWDFTRDFDGKEDEQSLGWALQENHHAIAYFLLARWAEVGLEHEIFFQRAFLATARYHSHWGIWVLKQHGADIEAVNGRKVSALLQLIDDENLPAFKTLLDNGANPDGNDKAPDVKPLILAAHRGLTDFAESLLQKSASIHVTDTIGMSALHWASDQDQLETVRLLLSHGADIEMIGADGMTPLHSAVTSGHLQMVKLLLEAGADVNAREGSLGKTPLMFAASHSFLAIVHLLLEQEADINVKDLNGSTALDWLRATKFSDSFEVIKEALEAHGMRS